MLHDPAHLILRCLFDNIKVSKGINTSENLSTNMTTLQLTSGRTVYLLQLSIVYTYAGVLEGSRATATEHISNSLSDRVRDIAHLNAPLYIIPPSTSPLPDYLWITEFLSNEAVHHKDPDYASELSVCWFSDQSAFDLKLNDFIRATIADIDWNKYAVDYDIMDF